MAFDVQTLAELAKCGDCLSPNQKQNVLLYLLNGILENGASGGGLHNLLSATHPDTVPGPPTRGALVVGNATPDWEALVIGANGRFLGSDGTDATWTVLPGSFTGFANPTASVGLVAVNGVATTAMRSDAAPPLSQAIAPTWTSLHIFAPIAAPAIQINPFGAAAGNTSEIRLLELAASGTNYTGFKAADAMAASEIYVLPNAAPSANRFLRAGAVAAGVSATSWEQISLTADVTGILPVANGGTGTSTAFTPGSVIFAGAAGVYTQDNANFFFDNTNNRLGLVTAAPGYTLHVLGPGSFQYGFAAGALLLGADLNATTISVNARKIGRVNMVSYDGGATNTFLFGGDLQAGINEIYFGGVSGGTQYAATGIHFFTGATQTTTGGTERMTIDNAGNVGIGIAVPLASLHIVPLTAPALLISPFGVAAGNTGEVRYRELTANGTNYTGFKAADSMAASEIYVLPNAAPSANRFLQAAAVAGGVSALSWVQVSLTADVTGILPVANGGTGTGTAFTAGSVIFAGSAGVYAQDNANFFWDDTNNRLGLGTASPNQQLELTGSLRLPTTTSTSGIIFQGANRLIHTFGTNNIFIGMVAGNFTMTGTENIGIGNVSLSGNTTGINNVGIGYAALLSNTTGFNNTALGFSALINTTTGESNSAFGFSALFTNITGSRNMGFGYSSLYLCTGSNNIAIGYDAAHNLTTGSNNIIIGYDVDSPTATNSNTLTLGNLLFGTAIDGTGTTLSSGNIGIGVITPLAKFHVTNSAAATVGSIFQAAAAQSANLTEWQDSGAVILSKVNSAGNMGVRMAATALTAYLHIAAGTTTASTAPIKLTSGTSMTTAEAGAMEFTTDDLFFTITTGAARKRLLMADATAGLTATRVPFATTNGRLTDDAAMTFATAILTVPNLTIGAAGVLKLGNAAVAATPTPTHTVTIQDSTGTTYRVPVVV